MATRELDVHLDGVLAGTARMSTAGALSFEYDEAYSSDSRATPLSMSMPLEVREHKNRAVLPFMQGLLPDNAQALASIATTYGVSAASPFAMLEHVGRDVAGALQFVPHGTPAPDAVGTRDRVRLIDDDEIGRRLADAIAEYRDGKPLTNTAGRFSLAGAQPKIALHRVGDSWGLPEDATPTTHILKPNPGEIADVDIVEQMTMSAARTLGLDVAESRIEEFGGIRTFVTTRYDRALIDGMWRRLHQEDLCQALAVPPAKKYQRIDGGQGVGDIADLALSFPVLEDRRDVARAFFAGFVFNVVAGGTDAHAKNYSLLLTHDRVTLAPLYDLVTFAPYRAAGEVVLLPMNVNGVYQSDSISSADLVRAGARLRVPAETASEIVESMRDAVVPAFEAAREELPATGAGGDVADRVVEAIKALPLAR